MKYNVVYATFVEKHNRFLCTIELDGTFHPCHIPNTGRLKELLYRGNTIAVRYVGHPNRKTEYELLLAQKDKVWYSVDSRMPNALVKEWASNGLIREWHGSTLVGEKTFGNSRFDFKIDGQLSGYIEVKGVTLEREGVGYFPDAPTERGRKHLEELMHVKDSGLYAAVVFICQSEHIQKFHPNDETDPQFGQLLRKLKSHEVDIFAFQAVVSETGISFGRQITVDLS
jgi:sugar fermentation stimulation protein A